jgi:hypothetical protein
MGVSAVNRSRDGWLCFVGDDSTAVLKQYPARYSRPAYEKVG